ncbi:MAG: TonB-dependent receptor [Bacteroidetes bacterium]|nr:TonB-dependent receptor [Bacteroidota bacterium]
MFKRTLLNMGLICILFTAATSFAGVTGKIAGRVIDKKTGEGLELANVVLVGTQYGASTSRTGNYVILGVPAGTYDLKFAYLGYRSVTVKNARVVPDITLEINMDLSELEIDLSEIVVSADRPLFEKGSTNTTRIVESDQLENLPVRGIENIAALQAGVVKSDVSGGITRSASLNIRGGRGNETLYIIDGVVVNDPVAVGGGNSGQVAQNAVDQLSIQIGGFEAKYGEAMSGIVNAITKSGQDYYAFGGEVVTSEYSDNYGYNQYTGNVSGPVYGIKDLTFFSSYERIWARDTNPRYTTDKARENMSGGVNRITGKLDYRFSPTFRFTTSFNGSNSMDREYVHSSVKSNSEHNPRRIQNEYSINQRVSWSIDETTFMNIDGYYRDQNVERGDGVWFDNLNAYGDTSYAYQFIDPLTGLHPGQASNYGPDELTIFDQKHAVTTGYSLRNISYWGGTLNFTSQQGNHLIEGGVEGRIHTFRTYVLGLNGLAQFKDSRTTEKRFFDARARAYGYDVNGNESDKGDGVTTFNPLYPIKASAYLQDKVELKDLIFNFGLRYDFYRPDGEKVKDPDAPTNLGGGSSSVGSEDFVAIEDFHFISPRLGIAFPVTDNSKFHAAYGRFIGYPALFEQYAFRNAIRFLDGGTTASVTNGHAKPENTIQYEVGYSYAFEKVASIDATLFYKEVRDLLNLNIYKVPGGVYYSVSNIDFSTIKGMSLAVNTRKFANFFSMSVNYMYQVAEGTGSSTDGNFQSAFRSGVIPRQVNPLSFDQRHTFSSSLDFRTGANDGPEMFGVRPISQVGAFLLMTFNSGRPYTPVEPYNTTTGDTAPITTSKGTVNSAYGPFSFRLDARFDKTVTFEFGATKLNTNFYVDIINLLNNENAVAIYRATGAPDDDGYFSTDAGKSTLNSFSDDPAVKDAYLNDVKRILKDPENYGAARQIRLGMRFDF